MIEMLIEKGIDLNLISLESEFTNKPIHNIDSEEIILYLIEKEKITLDETIFNNSIKNNWNKVCEYYFKNNLIDFDKIYKLWTLSSLLVNGNYKYAYDVLSNSLTNLSINIINNLEHEYVSIYKFQNDEDIKDTNDENNKDK
jgi:hypothetical protein